MSPQDSIKVNYCVRESNSKSYWSLKYNILNKRYPDEYFKETLFKIDQDRAKGENSAI